MEEYEKIMNKPCYHCKKKILEFKCECKCGNEICRACSRVSHLGYDEDNQNKCVWVIQFGVNDIFLHNTEYGAMKHVSKLLGDSYFFYKKIEIKNEKIWTFQKDVLLVLKKIKVK